MAQENCEKNIGEIFGLSRIKYQRFLFFLYKCQNPVSSLSTFLSLKKQVIYVEVPAASFVSGFFFSKKKTYEENESAST